MSTEKKISEHSTDNSKKTDEDDEEIKEIFPLKQVFDNALERAREIRKKYSDDETLTGKKEGQS